MSRGGSTRAWRRVREYVLRRDQHTCRRIKADTGRPCLAYATTAGHIVAVELGGTDHPDNLRAECTSCNYADGARRTNRNRRNQKGPK